MISHFLQDCGPLRWHCQQSLIRGFMWKSGIEHGYFVCFYVMLVSTVRGMPLSSGTLVGIVCIMYILFEEYQDSERSRALGPVKGVINEVGTCGYIVWINISLKPQNGKEILGCVNNFVVKLTVLKCYRKRCKSRDGIFGLVSILPLGRSGIRIPVW
jgi:hypothetical protein